MDQKRGVCVGIVDSHMPPNLTWQHADVEVWWQKRAVRPFDQRHHKCSQIAVFDIRLAFRELDVEDHFGPVIS